MIYEVVAMVFICSWGHFSRPPTRPPYMKRMPLSKRRMHRHPRKWAPWRRPKQLAMEVCRRENHQTKWWIFQQTMFGYQRVLVMMIIQYYKYSNEGKTMINHPIFDGLYMFIPPIYGALGRGLSLFEPHEFLFVMIFLQFLFFKYH